MTAGSLPSDGKHIRRSWADRRRSQLAARACIERLLLDLQTQIQALREENDTLKQKQIKTHDTLVEDRIACVRPVLEALDGGPVPAPEVTLRRNIACHVRADLLQGKLVTQLSGVELRKVQKGRLRTDGVSADASGNSFSWNSDAPEFVPDVRSPRGWLGPASTDSPAATFPPARLVAPTLDSGPTKVDAAWKELALAQQSTLAVVCAAEPHPQLAATMHNILLHFNGLRTEVALQRKTGFEPHSARDTVVKTVNSPSPDCVNGEEITVKPKKDEIMKLQETVADLRRQLATRAAKEARHDHLTTHGRLLQALRLPAGATDAQFSIGEVFTKHAGCATEAEILEPYLIAVWQLANFRVWLEALLELTHVRSVRLVSHERSRTARNELNDMVTSFRPLGLSFTFAFQADLHLREVTYSNGIVITSDRGLDIFRPPNHAGVRHCRSSTVLYFECDKQEVARQSNVAAVVAEEAKTALINTLADDMLHIHALVQTSSAATSSQDQPKQVKQLRKELEDAEIERAIRQLGFISSTEARRPNGFSMQECVMDLRARCPDYKERLEKLPRLIPGLVSIDALVKKFGSAEHVTWTSPDWAGPAHEVEGDREIEDPLLAANEEEFDGGTRHNRCGSHDSDGYEQEMGVEEHDSFRLDPLELFGYEMEEHDSFRLDAELFG